MAGNLFHGFIGAAQAATWLHLSKRVLGSLLVQAV
jgi:hypothetical protein